MDKVIFVMFLMGVGAIVLSPILFGIAKLHLRHPYFGREKKIIITPVVSQETDGPWYRSHIIFTKNNEYYYISDVHATQMQKTETYQVTVRGRTVITVDAKVRGAERIHGVETYRGIPVIDI